MFIKIKGLFLFVFLILLQSCSGGKVGNFLESSFDNLGEINKIEDSKKRLNTERKADDKKILQEIKKEDDQITVSKSKKEFNSVRKNNNKKILKVVKKRDDETIASKSKKELNTERKANDKKILQEIKKKDDQITVSKNKKVIDLKMKSDKGKRIMSGKNFNKKRRNELQSYKIIFILKDVDPKDPTKNISNLLRNSDINFEIEKIEKFVDFKNNNKKIN